MLMSGPSRSISPSLLCLLASLLVLPSCETYAAIVGPLNPSFEVSDGSLPAEWEVRNFPLYAADPAEAFGGSASVLASRRDLYLQVLPAEPRRIYTFGHWARGTTGREFSNFQVQWRDADGRRLAFNSRPLPAGAAYEFQAHSALSQPGTESMEVVLIPSSGWVHADNTVVLDDSLANPGMADWTGDSLPDAWGIGGPMQVEPLAGQGGDNPAVRLHPAAQIVQSVAVLPYTRAHLSVAARGDPGTQIRLSLFWRDERGYIHAVTEQDFALSTSYQTFSLSGDIPRDSVFVDVAITNNSATGLIRVDDAGYAWLAAKPNPFSPNGDEVRDETVISGFVSGGDLVSAMVLDDQGQSVADLGVLPATSALEWTWDGTTAGDAILADGTYTVELTYAAPAPGDFRTVTLPLVLQSPRFYDELGTPPAGFLRVVWGSGGRTPYRFRGFFEDLRDYGMTDVYLIPFTEPEEIQVVLDLAEAAGMKLILNPSDLIPLIMRQGFFETVPEEFVYQEFLAKYGAILDHPALRGFVSMDEPSEGSVNTVPDTLLYQRMLAHLAPDRVVVFNHSPTREPGPIDAVIDPTLEVVSVFPLRVGGSYGDIGDYEIWLDRYSDQTQALDIDLLYFIQSFEELLGSGLRAPLPPEFRLVANLALGRAPDSMGYFTALSYAPSTSGLLGPDGQEMRYTKDVQALNERLAALSPLLEALEVSPASVATASPGRVFELMENQAQPVLLVLNDDVEYSRTVRVAITGIPPPRLEDALTGATIPFQTTPAGYEFALVLAPGDGRYVRVMP